MSFFFLFLKENAILIPIALNWKTNIISVYSIISVFAMAHLEDFTPKHWFKENENSI